MPAITEMSARIVNPMFLVIQSWELLVGRQSRSRIAGDFDITGMDFLGRINALNRFPADNDAFFQFWMQATDHISCSDAVGLAIDVGIPEAAMHIALRQHGIILVNAHAEG